MNRFVNAVTTTGTQTATAGKSRGRLRAALSKRSMQADIIVIVISVCVLLGGFYVWNYYGNYIFPTTYCGVNTSCHSSFSTMSDCKYYASQNGFPTGQCVRVSQDGTGLDLMIVGVALFIVSALTGLVIIFTTKLPLEAMLKTSL